MTHAHYFPHDYHARHDPKLLALRRRHGLAGLGLYWCLVEFLYEQDGELEADEVHDLAYDLRCEEDLLAAVLYAFGLFNWDPDTKRLTSARVTERLQIRAEKSEKAQKSAANRWRNANAMPSQSERNANAMRTHTTPQSDRNAKKEKERKEKESKKDSKLTLPDADGVVVSQTTTDLEEVALLISPGAREAWAGYLELRRRQRWPVTPYALRLIARKLQQLRPDDGEGQRHLLETAAERGWRSVFEPRDQNPNTRNHDPKPTLDQKYNDHAHALAAKWGVR